MMEKIWINDKICNLQKHKINKTHCDKFPPTNKNLSFSEDAFEDAAEPEEKDKIPEAAGPLTYDHEDHPPIQIMSVTKCCYNHNQY